jgi:formate dehydrogenase subunit gamma
MTTSVTDVMTEAAIAATVAAHRGQRGPLLEILHAMQSELGHAPKEAVPLLARGAQPVPGGRSRSDLLPHDFHEKPAGRTTVRICRAEACQALGANAPGAGVRSARLGGPVGRRGHLYSALSCMPINAA